MSDWTSIVLAIVSLLGGTGGIVALINARTIARKTTVECWRDLYTTLQERLREVDGQITRLEGELRQERERSLRLEGKVQQLEIEREQWESERKELLAEIQELRGRIHELEGVKA
jgi:chromosome segregation ATPase